VLNQNINHALPFLRQGIFILAKSLKERRSKRGSCLEIRLRSSAINKKREAHQGFSFNSFSFSNPVCSQTGLSINFCIHCKNHSPPYYFGVAENLWAILLRVHAHHPGKWFCCIFHIQNVHGYRGDDLLHIGLYTVHISPSYRRWVWYE
jgi:hypothetical protein